LGNHYLAYIFLVAGATTLALTRFFSTEYEDLSSQKKFLSVLSTLPVFLGVVFVVPVLIFSVLTILVYAVGLALVIAILLLALGGLAERSPLEDISVLG
jgi:hypothetical protein